MAKVRIDDRTKEFANAAEEKIDSALKKMAADITTIAKVKNVPVKTGMLQSHIKPVKEGKMNYVVIADMPYARFQEFGGDSKRKVRHYTKPGTGPHYLKNSGDTVTKLFKDYIKSKVQLIYRKF